MYSETIRCRRQHAETSALLKDCTPRPPQVAIWEAWRRAGHSCDTPITRETAAEHPEGSKRPRSGPGPAPPSAAQHISDRILYTESVQAHWTETTVGEHGELVLEGVPFAPGQPVEVLVVSKTAGSTSAGGRSLRDSVIEFREPLEPVAGEDWDALQ